MARPTARVRPLLLAIVLALAVLVAACGGSDGGEKAAQQPAQAGESLRVALIPNQEPDKVKAQYQPFGDYLEQKLGMPVELDVPTGYPAVVEAMANDRIDLALFGGLTYVQARQRADVTPLVTDVNPETGTTKYTSEIIVPADSGVRKVEDLQGKTFAFGSVSSTSGSLYPALMLDKAGIDYREELERTTYTNGHDATAAAVASGTIDAGGLEGRILRRLVEKGTVDGSQIRSIATSDPIEGYPWVVRDAVDPELQERIRSTFLDLKDPKLLALLNAKGFEAVDAKDYDDIEDAAKQLDLLTAKSP
jgi:phosphonate transport system substrate-binding protein